MTIDKMPGLTPRVLLVVILLTPLNCYFLIQLELVRYTFPTWIVPLSNIIFILMIVMVINRLVHWITPRIALRQNELLVLYVMLSITTTLSACGVLQATLSVLEYGFWFATPENEYRDLLWRYIPEWLTVSDTRALRGYYEGDSSIYLAHNLKVWVPVVIAWLLLFMVLAFIFVCLNTILRRQWVEHERLTYPITRLPLEMTSPVSGFFRSKMMWTGFAIAAGISLLNGLSFLYPAIPSIRVTRRFFTFHERPLSFYNGVTIAFYPFAIGIMFLMPLDVLFSITIFFALYRNELALGQAMAWRSLSKFPYRDEQAFGAFLGICIFLFWIGRKHFSHVIKNAFGFKADPYDAEEPMSYRVALWGLLAGLILFAFLLHKAGMAFWLAGIFAVLFLVIPIVSTRIRAEAGTFVHCYPWIAPRYILITALGTRRLGHQNLTTLAVCFFNRSYKAQDMPHQLEAFKISNLVNIRYRRMLFAILVATALGVLTAFWTQLHLYYRFGADSGYFGPWALGYGKEYFEELSGWISHPTGTDWISLLFMGVGFSVVALLSYLRIRFFWLPLHPLGYLIANGGEMSDLWLPIFISMTLKWLILKHGGIHSYRRFVPFFLGLVLGDYLMGSLWSLLSVLLNISMYQFYP